MINLQRKVRHNPKEGHANLFLEFLISISSHVVFESYFNLENFVVQT